MIESRIGMDWTGTERSGKEWIGAAEKDRKGSEWIGRDRIGQEWKG